MKSCRGRTYQSCEGIGDGLLQETIGTLFLIISWNAVIVSCDCCLLRNTSRVRTGQVVLTVATQIPHTASQTLVSTNTMDCTVIAMRAHYLRVVERGNDAKRKYRKGGNDACKHDCSANSHIASENGGNAFPCINEGIELGILQI